MSSKPAKKTSESPVARKKKRTGSKKTTKSVTRKAASRSTTARKKVVKKKPVKKKTRTRKAAAKKVQKKASRKKITRKGAQLQAAVSPDDDGVENGMSGEEQSISWMSAQASSALKAVKANQAVKGQSVLAKNKKNRKKQPIDDASLIEIAENMPVDDAALIEFSAEELQPEAVQMSSTTSRTPMPESNDVTIEDTNQTAAASNTNTRDIDATAAEETTVAPPMPPPENRRSSRRWPALLGISLVAVLLGLTLWPNRDDTAGKDVPGDAGLITDLQPAPAIVAVPARTPDVSSTGSVSGDTDPMQDVVTTQADRVPASKDAASWEPSNMPPVATPEPPLASAKSTPDPAAPTSPSPAVATEPAAVQTQAPAETAPTAMPPGRYRTPGYGYYPQSRQPAYPGQYYRQYR